MKVWKVILAALVIFAAGVVTGGLTVRLKLHQAPAAQETAIPGGSRQRQNLLDRLQRQLYLTATQRERIEQILRESHDRMKQLWDSIAPQAQAERRRVHDAIKAELAPDQQLKFEAIMKPRSQNRQADEKRRRDEKHEPRPGRRPDTSSQAGQSKSNSPAPSSLP